MLDAMAETIYFRKMNKHVRAYVQSCYQCARSKPNASIDLLTSLPQVKAHDAESEATVFDAIMTITCLLTRAASFLPTIVNLTGAGAARLMLETLSVGRNVPQQPRCAIHIGRVQGGNELPQHPAAHVHKPERRDEWSDRSVPPYTQGLPNRVLLI